MGTGEGGYPSDGGLPLYNSENNQVEDARMHAPLRKNVNPETHKIGLLDFLGKLGGPVFLVSALAFAFAYRETTSYFTYLGAPWFASLLTPQAIIIASARTLWPLVFATFLVLIYPRSRQVDNIQLSVAIVAAICAFALVAGSPLFVSKRDVFGSVYYVSAGFAGISCGCLFAEFRNLRERRASRLPYSFNLVLTIATYVFLWFYPTQIGKLRAHFDSDPGASALSVAHLNDTPQEVWRLVYPAGDKVLLMKWAKERPERRFRVVGIDDVQEIGMR
ncbi:hypothetical protein PCA31118_02693 [Pandoraea captiosa]|uniref:Uncharacterized protein n=1 Tax=Pandoraea captiosa TaxID=2508302 RepID=A0A5E5A440_9BURK|nr:hypothetical protein [Pandoraea captiosa]VVE67888.1 hypothetical protein PCA31118_02693 [Pandoraea captiosa]